MASSGVAKDRFDIDAEDTITLTVEWQNLSEPVERGGAGIFNVNSTVPQRCSLLAPLYTRLVGSHQRVMCIANSDSSTWATTVKSTWTRPTEVTPWRAMVVVTKV